MHKTVTLSNGQKQAIRRVNRDYWLPVEAATPKVHKPTPWYYQCDKRLAELVQRYSIAG